MDTLELDGVRLAYSEEGSGQPLVLVHGVGTSGELWAGDIAPLARDCQMMVYDRRGYGISSELPRDWQAHREDAIALIDALRAAPAVLVGYSGGSIIVLDLASAPRWARGSSGVTGDGPNQERPSAEASQGLASACGERSEWIAATAWQESLTRLRGAVELRRLRQAR